MRCELSFFWDEDDAVEVVETLYHIAACQKEELILEIGGDSYVFPLLYDDKLRLQKIKNIYRKCSKSPKWGNE
jgi:hypothetical protein